MRNQKGITMIALIITIAVMLILLSVTISTVVTDEDVVGKAREAEKQSNEARAYEELYAAWSATETEYWNSATLQDRDEFFTKDKLNENLKGKGQVETDFTYVENGNTAISYTSAADGKTYELEIYTTESDVDAIPEDELTKNTYTVTYYNEDGSVFKTVTVEEGSSATISNKPTKTGYTFKYWATDTTGTNQANLESITSNMSVYPYFTIDTFTVTYKTYNGSSTYYTEQVNYGGTARYSGYPTRNGYVFRYWATAANGSVQVDLTNITSNMTVYAYYTKEIESPAVCFVAGTKVLTEYGLMNIEDITVGTKVYSYNEGTKEVELKDVTMTHKNYVDKDMTKVTINGEVIESTSGHEYYTVNKGWVPAKDLVKGDRVITVSGENFVVENVETTECTGKIYTTVYNLTVENNHNYYVSEENVLVHNVPSPTQGHSGGC